MALRNQYYVSFNFVVHTKIMLSAIRVHSPYGAYEYAPISV